MDYNEKRAARGQGQSPAGGLSPVYLHSKSSLEQIRSARLYDRGMILRQSQVYSFHTSFKFNGHSFVTRKGNSSVTATRTKSFLVTAVLRLVYEKSHPESCARRLGAMAGLPPP
jgi:hypothetical protein